MRCELAPANGLGQEMGCREKHPIRALVLITTLLVMTGQQAGASIAIENVDIELSRLSPGANTSHNPNLIQVTKVNENKQTNASRANPIDSDAILTSETAGQPPIYQSVPKQIDSLDVTAASKRGGASHHQAGLEQQVGQRTGQGVATDDLDTAAGHYKKKKHHHKKKKIIVVKKKKKKKRKKKKKKKKKMVVVVKKKKKGKKHHHHKKKKKKVIYYKPKHSHRIEHKHHYKPESYHQEPTYSHHHHHEPAAAAGKYYEYRSVPKQGAWDFGFKRGNLKHHIERKEQGHKSHFKTIFNWKDKRGNGKHLFDYNHQGGHHHHSYHAAATKHAPKTAEVGVLAPTG